MRTSDVAKNLRRLAPLTEEQARLAWALFLAGHADERVEAAELVDVLLWQQAHHDYERKIYLDPPPRSRCDGAYRLGSVLYPPGRVYAPFGLREEDWTRHVLIVGRTGAGKTTLALNLLQVLHALNKPVLIFDWKRSYRDLLQRALFRELRVFTVGRPVRPFLFNPLLPPPGVHYGEWLMKLIDVLKHAYFVGEGVEYLLRRGLDHVYRTCGYDGDTPHSTPLFQNVLAFVIQQRLQGRMSLWRASALRVLDSLCFRHGLGPIMNTQTGFDEALLGQMVVLELDSLADADKIFLTEALILWIYEYRKTRGKRDVFTHALLIEEAHHVLSEHKERTTGSETIMETCLRQIREFGEAVIVIDQEPSKLSNSIKANTETKIIFGLSNATDLREMTQALGLETDEELYLHLLTTGQAIAKHSRIPHPIHVRFPPFPIVKGRILDNHLKDRN